MSALYDPTLTSVPVTAKGATTEDDLGELVDVPGQGQPLREVDSLVLPDLS